MKWTDIAMSGGLSAFVAGMTIAWGIIDIFKENYTSAVIQFTLCAVNVTSYLFCVRKYRSRIEHEVEAQTVNTFYNSLPTLEEPPVYVEKEVKKEIIKVEDHHHCEGRLIRVEKEDRNGN
jgi:hypothetical protein